MSRVNSRVRTAPLATGACALAWAALTLSGTSADSPVARRSPAGHGSASLLCCEPGHDRTSGHCLEILTRTPIDPGSREAKRRCRQASRGESLAPAERGLIELDNDQFSHNGFQGGATADGNGEIPKMYRADDGKLAILGDACRDWRDPAGRNCPLYLEVDAFLAFDDRISQDEVDEFSRMHPWSRGPYAGRIRVDRVKNLDELTAWTKSLARSCQVIRRIFVSSHGSPGTLYLSVGDAVTGTMSVQDALNKGGLGCLLVPDSRVQFDGCQVACGNQAAQVLSTLGTLAASPAFKAPHETAPFDRVRFLFNTSYGEYMPSIANFFAGSGWHWNPSIIDRDNGAVMYTINGQQASSDVPVDRVRACSND